MNRSYPLVEIHYALWAVLSVPLGFAGMFFLVPGLILEWGVALLLISGLLILYISSLTRQKAYRACTERPMAVGSKADAR